ncbi:MAG: hypothetical protein KY439_11660 [Actinobacteria bacterium]|nr:hypothetical protein [Actinomycetota bacterium]
MRCSLHHERGQVAPLLALLTVAVGLACLGLGRFGASAVELAQARTAADAAALAGAAGGESEARRLAQANGADLSSFEAAGGDVRAEATTASGATARARARREGGPLRPGPRALSPVLRTALTRAEELLGTPIPTTSGAVPGEAPGSAMHDHGLAVDVAAAAAPGLAAVADQVGLCQPYPRTHPVHFEACGARLPSAAPG